jgi:hypothetical protein
MKRRRPLLPLLLVGLALPACGVPLPTDGPDVPGVPAALQGEWKQLQLAPWNTRYQGDRRISFYLEMDGQEPIFTQYVERVSCDGEGNFHILPLYAESLVAPDEATFLLLQERREGFFFRYRDFRIRDLTAFLQNYRNLNAGKSVTVAGRPAWEVVFVRKIPGGRHYVVDFDIETGLVLGYEEYDDTGAKVATLEYLSIEMDPDLDGVPYFVPGNNERPIDLATEDPVAILGFRPRLPQQLPPGFSLLETASVTDDAGNQWFKAGYSDGVEMLFFLHRERTKAVYQLPVSSSSRQTQSRDEVTVFRAGNVIAAQGTVKDQELIAVGEVPESDLLMMINTAR